MEHINLRNSPTKTAFVTALQHLDDGSRFLDCVSIQKVLAGDWNGVRSSDILKELMEKGMKISIIIGKN